jgi:hypothetical protein
MLLDMVNEKKESIGSMAFSLRLRHIEDLSAVASQTPGLLSPEELTDANNVCLPSTVQKVAEILTGADEMTKGVEDEYTLCKPLSKRFEKAVELVDRITTVLAFLAWIVPQAALIDILHDLDFSVCTNGVDDFVTCPQGFLFSYFAYRHSVLKHRIVHYIAE